MNGSPPRPAPARPGSAAGRVVERRVGACAAIVAGAVLFQGVLGSQATGRGAAYVFNAIPIWLANDAWSGHIREVLHVSHRFAGYAVAALVIVVAVVARRLWRATPGTEGWVAVVPQIAMVLVVVQVGLDIANVLTRANVWSAIGHLTVASWMWAAAVLAAALGLAPSAAARSPRLAAEPTPHTAQQPVDEECNPLLHESREAWWTNE